MRQEAAWAIAALLLSGAPGLLASAHGSGPEVPLLVDLAEVPPQEAPGIALSALLPLSEGSASLTFARLLALSGGALALPEPRAATPPWLADAPGPMRPALAALAGGLAAAEGEMALALADLLDEERAGYLETMELGLEAAQSLAMGSQAPRDLEALNAFTALAGQVHLEHVAMAELNLLIAVERAMELLGQRSVSQAAAAAICATGQVVFETAGCNVIVGGPGANSYAIDAQLIVDLGGADTYTNRAGGTSPFSEPAALVLDLGSGDDLYSASDATDGVQGGAFLGAGLLVDEGGSDTYEAFAQYPYTLPRLTAQGSGIVGAGVLWDRGDGDDSYYSRNVAQGTGIQGYGLLLDEGGNDTYTIPYTFDSEGGQGTGCYASFGALIDRGEGVDVYDASIADMQGFGCNGGIGVLWDGGGADEYILRHGLGQLTIDGVPQIVTQSGWGQGYGELGGVGILLDVGGGDSYTVTGTVTYTGHQTQGAAFAGGVGMVLDLEGDDDYVARTSTQAFGGAGALGLLYDGSGDDSYAAVSACQGYASGAAGVLMDLGGGLDSYECTQATLVGSRANDVQWLSGLGGVGVDA